MRNRYISEQEHRRAVQGIYRQTGLGERASASLVLLALGGVGSAGILLYALGYLLRHVFHIYPPANFH